MPTFSQVFLVSYRLCSSHQSRRLFARCRATSLKTRSGICTLTAWLRAAVKTRTTQAVQRSKKTSNLSKLLIRYSLNFCHVLFMWRCLMKFMNKRCYFRPLTNDAIEEDAEEPKEASHLDYKYLKSYEGPLTKIPKNRNQNSEEKQKLLRKKSTKPKKQMFSIERKKFGGIRMC